MKKALIFSVIILSVLYSTDAQWYERSCGVTNLDSITIQEFECMWKRASKNVLPGKITTIYGTIAAVSGAIWGGLAYDLAVIPGYTLMTAGLITLGIGITVWSVGSVRQSKLKEYSHFNILNRGSLMLAPSIIKNHINNFHAYGVTATLSF